MKSFTATNSIKLKNGGQTSTPFIKLKSFNFNEVDNRIDCHILICKSKTHHQENETKIENREGKVDEIKAANKSIKTLVNSNKDKVLTKAALTKVQSDLDDLHEIIYSSKWELSELPKPDDVYTSQYPCFDSNTALSEDEVFDLVKYEYSGVEV